MNLETFARRVLFGPTLEDKLVTPSIEAFREELSSSAVSPALASIPKLPGRPPALSLSHQEKARFPELARIHEAQVRGEILHFFANHELLALELMALLLLRFPEAPASFRLGIVRTMSEEQGHLRLYLKRMKELGVSFGDLPVNGYFWQVLSSMRSPLDFVTQMSLTFEQANLDFSLFYRDAVAQTGDQETTQVLDQVYREEIGHVKHGLEWFNRWRVEDSQAPKGESDWDAYRRLLPPPLTPRRAKGQIFALEARKLAGLSETFVRELELFSGSKGRPPVLWIFNPFCDAEIARGKVGYSPKAAPLRLAQDLEHIPMFLASPQDTVLVSERPSLEWLTLIRKAGFQVPEWSSRNPKSLREPKFGGFEPWGWSPETFELFRPLRARLAPTQDGNAFWCQSLFESETFGSTKLGPLFSKAWSTDFFKNWLISHPKEAQELGCLESVGSSFSTWESAHAHLTRQLKKGNTAVVKAPWSTSGNGVRQVLKEEELAGPMGGWIKNTIETQGEVIIEPRLEKVHDLSIQIEVGSQNVRVLEARKFITGKQFEYRGTFLGPLRDAFEASSLRLLQEKLPVWKMLARDLGATLSALGYEGPAGLDAMIFRTPSGELRLKPLVELNPRWTMGRVALAFEKNILPGTPAAWVFVSLRELEKHGVTTFEGLWQNIKTRFPLQMTQTAGGSRIAAGALTTQDPLQACEALSILFVGHPAFQVCRKEFLGLTDFSKA